MKVGESIVSTDEYLELVKFKENIEKNMSVKKDYGWPYSNKVPVWMSNSEAVLKLGEQVESLNGKINMLNIMLNIKVEKPKKWHDRLTIQEWQTILLIVMSISLFILAIKS